MRGYGFRFPAAGIIAAVVFASALMARSHAAHSAEITRSPTGHDGRADIVLDGPIYEGDAAEFRAVVDSILDDGMRIHIAHLNSPGGSVTEAFKIGDTIRLLKLDTAAPTKLIWKASCDSACFLIWAAGTGRYGDDLGIHRPIYNPADFARFTPQKASVEYRTPARRVERKLTEWGVPDAVVTQMMGVSSLEINELDEATITELRDDPAFSEPVIARCGYAPYSSGPIRPVFDECPGEVLEERLDEGIRQYRAAYAVR
jgi:hypothetical protein